MVIKEQKKRRRYRSSLNAMFLSCSICLLILLNRHFPATVIIYLFIRPNPCARLSFVRVFGELEVRFKVISVMEEAQKAVIAGKTEPE